MSEINKVNDMVVVGLNDQQQKAQSVGVSSESEQEQETHWGVSDAHLNKACEHVCNLLEKKGIELVAYNGEIDQYAMSYAFQMLLATIQRVTKNAEKLKSELEAKQNEVDDYAEFIRQYMTPEQLESYAKWKEKQTQGRKRKSIDWNKYEHLVSAGLQQKQIAEILGVSPNTLRKLEKEAGKPSRRAGTRQI